jgi:hypothetical protein
MRQLADAAAAALGLWRVGGMLAGGCDATLRASGVAGFGLVMVRQVRSPWLGLF